MRIKMITAKVREPIDIFRSIIRFSVINWSPISSSSKYFLKGCIPGSFPFAFGWYTLCYSSESLLAIPGWLPAACNVLLLSRLPFLLRLRRDRGLHAPTRVMENHDPSFPSHTHDSTPVSVHGVLRHRIHIVFAIDISALRSMNKAILFPSCSTLSLPHSLVRHDRADRSKRFHFMWLLRESGLSFNNNTGDMNAPFEHPHLLAPRYPGYRRSVWEDASSLLHLGPHFIPL